MWGTLVIVLFFAVFAQNYVTSRNLINILRNASILLIVSCGMGISILSSQIDISIGGVMTISAMAAAMFIHPIADPNVFQLLATLAIGLGVGAAFGLFNGIMIGKYNYNYWLVTFATMSIGYGAAQVINGGFVISGFSRAFRNISSYRIFGMPSIIYISIILTLVMIFFTYKTRFGMHLYAVGDSEQCAEQSGINVVKIRVLVYVISGLLAGLGGVLLVSRTNSASANVANGYEFNAIANVIIGGTSFEGGKGGLKGTFAGSIIMAAIANGLQLMGVSNYLQQVFTGVFILTIIVIDVISERRKKLLSLRRVYKHA